MKVRYLVAFMFALALLFSLCSCEKAPVESEIEQSKALEEYDPVVESEDLEFSEPESADESTVTQATTTTATTTTTVAKPMATTTKAPTTTAKPTTTTAPVKPTTATATKKSNKPNSVYWRPHGEFYLDFLREESGKIYANIPVDGQFKKFYLKGSSDLVDPTDEELENLITQKDIFLNGTYPLNAATDIQKTYFVDMSEYDWWFATARPYQTRYGGFKTPIDIYWNVCRPDKPLLEDEVFLKDSPGMAPVDYSGAPGNNYYALIAYAPKTSEYNDITTAGFENMIYAYKLTGDEIDLYRLHFKLTLTRK